MCLFLPDGWVRYTEWGMAVLFRLEEAHELQDGCNNTSIITDIKLESCPLLATHACLFMCQRNLNCIGFWLASSDGSTIKDCIHVLFPSWGHKGLLTWHYNTINILVDIIYSLADSLVYISYMHAMYWFSMVVLHCHTLGHGRYWSFYYEIEQWLVSGYDICLPAEQRCLVCWCILPNYTPCHNPTSPIRVMNA